MQLEDARGCKEVELRLNEAKLTMFELGKVGKIRECRYDLKLLACSMTSLILIINKGLPEIILMCVRVHVCVYIFLLLNEDRKFKGVLVETLVLHN